MVNLSQMNQADYIRIQCSSLPMLNINPLVLTTSLEETVGVENSLVATVKKHSAKSGCEEFCRTKDLVPLTSK